jgi:hypothetical protein
LRIYPALIAATLFTIARRVVEHPALARVPDALTCAIQHTVSGPTSSTSCPASSGQSIPVAANGSVDIAGRIAAHVALGIAGMAGLRRSHARSRRRPVISRQRWRFLTRYCSNPTWTPPALLPHAG